MRFLQYILAIFLTCTLTTPTALASWNQVDLTNANNAEPETKNSKYHGYKLGQGKCTFNPSATSGDRTVGAHGCGLVIPKNAIVTRVVYKTLTTFTSATDAATIAVKIVGANDVVTAVAISDGANPWDAGVAKVTTPVTQTASTWLTTTADSEVTFTVAVEALTAGKLVAWVEWLYYGDI
jgi:hypothetical protein